MESDELWGWKWNICNLIENGEFWVCKRIIWNWLKVKLNYEVWSILKLVENEELWVWKWNFLKIFFNLKKKNDCILNRMGI